MLAANEGIGHLIFHSRTNLQTELIFVGIFMLGVLGLAADYVFRRAIGRLAWRYQLH